MTSHPSSTTEGTRSLEPAVRSVEHVDVEKAVAEIWAEVLELDDITPSDDFFELGGDSLSAIQILSRIQKRFQIKITEAEFFTGRTVSGLCRFLHQAQMRTTEAGAVLKAQPSPRVQFPATSSQQRLWVLDQFIANPEVYNIPFLLQIQGDLDPEALRVAFERIAVRQEVLRLHFASDNGVPVQIIGAPEQVELPVVDLRQLSHQERMDRILGDANREAATPMDLTAKHLWNARLYHTGHDEYFLWTNLHHTLTDGWSYGVLFKDLEKEYEAARKGEAAQLPPLAIQYGDYAVWQRDWLNTPSYREQVEHWKKILAAPVPTLELPFSKPRPRVQTFHGALHTFQIPRKLTNAIDKLSRQESVTRFMLGLAAFQVVLNRYTGQEDLLIGTPVANRNRPEVEPLVGFFVNTLILRTKLDGDPTFRELLDRVRQVRLDAFTHQDIPLESLIEELQPPRDTSRQPFFQVVFQYQNVKIIPERLSRHKMTMHPVHNHTSMFDLRIVMEDGPFESLWAWIEYNTDLFEPAHIEQLAQNFLTILESAVAAPNERISKLPMLSAENKQRIIYDWNKTEADYPADRCFHEFFENQAIATPDAVAVVVGGQTVTYRQLNSRANQLAHYLRSEGVKPGVFVGVCVKRTADMPVAVLAVLKAGGAYVPLDSTYPKDRLAFMLQDAKAPIVLTQSDLLPRLPEGTSRRVCIDQLGSELQRFPTTNPDRINGPDDLAYVIYTSGSTGLPKGVMLRHRPVCNILDWVNQSFQVGASDRLLFVTSLSFDLSVYDIFGVLGVGGSIRMATEEELRDPGRLMEILCTEPITIWDSAPAALQQLAPFFASRMALAKQSTPLRLVMLSGDWIPVPLPDQVRAIFTSAKVISLGGATEAAIWSNWYPIDKVDPKWPSIPYGKPIRNAHYHILDKHLQPVPVGIPGELHIGGAVLADGYLNRAELSAERFIVDPFAKTPGAKLYKTGDLARYFPDGNIEFLGRMDTQIKVRGFRVEAGEIESVLAEHPSVGEAVVRPHKDSSNQIFLVAYLVPQGDAKLDPEALAVRLREKLPEYMVPAQFVILEKMPLTPNGKLDRAALQPPALESKRSTRSYEPPVDAIEQGIADTWTQVLEVEKVGRNDNFFELGGHSLRGAQLIARIQDRFQVALRLPVVFEKPTVAGMAEAVRQAGLRTSEQRPMLRRHKEITDRAPLSLVQQRFWFIDRTIPDRAMYNVNDRFRIHGPLNAEAFRKAWAAVVARQESLRTIFVEDDSGVFQLVLPRMTGVVAIADLAETSDDLEKLIAEEARLPFNLQQEPLWRATLYRLSPTEHVFHWNIHHIVMDESSRSILLRDLWFAYDNLLQGKDESLRELPLRYTDFAATQREQLNEKGLAPHLAYWGEKLRGAAVPVVPPHLKPRPLQRTYQGGLLRFALPTTIANGMKELSRTRGVTPFIAYLAAFQTLLARYADQTDICVGTPVSNRPVGGTNRIVGCFVNTLPIRIDLSGNPNFGEVLNRVRTVMAEAMAHDEVPFERIIEVARPEHTPGGHPLFQTMFVYQNEELRGSAPGGLTWEMEQTDHVGAKFDFTIAIEDRPGRLATAIEYAGDLYDEETICRISTHFIALLEAIVAEPNAPITRLPIMAEAERKQVVETWNAAKVEYPTDRCVHHLIEAMAEQTPKAIAFEHAGHTLTMQEWNEQANRLAGYLRANGVGPNIPVAVCVERSLEMPIALLAVLKAGGGYVPLDPSHPADRLAYMIADTKAPVLLTQSHLAEKLPQDGATVVKLDQLTTELRLHGPENLDCNTKPENLFAAIYTSGSTGRPKGTALHHAGVVSLLHSIAQQTRITAEDVCLAVSTYSFDIHVLDFWWPPLHGTRVVIAPRDVAVDGPKMATEIEKHHATLMSVTPATWRLLLEANWRGAPKMKAISGGEAITAEMARNMVPRVAEFWNIYGPTETTVFVVSQLVKDTTKAPPVGKTLANAKIYILDKQRNPVPIGCPGEVYVGGVHVGIGYLHQPQMTAERYIADPFNAGSRLYRTGDIGRRLPDGTIDVLGRADFQVKIRGFRIELGEIEQVLEEHPGIRQAVVITRKSFAGLDTLYAYLLPKQLPAPTPAELRQYLLGKLPDYMVPAAFTVMEKFPLSPNRKVDRTALPEPAQESHATTAREHVPPINDPERALQPIWEEVFGIKPIGVTDDFYELGGHSLLAAVLMSRIETQLGHRVPLEMLFSAPTIRGLASRIQQKLELGTGGVMVPLQTTGSAPPMFLIAGAGGHVFAFHKFVRLLGPEFNAYGMKAVGVDGTEPPLDSVEAIADRYIKEMTTACPDGPCIVGGYSVGGLVAFEIALRLQAAGRRVSRVILFDLFAPGHPKRASLLKRAFLHAKNLTMMPWRKKWSYLRDRISHIRTRVMYKLGRHDKVAEEVPGLDIIPQERLKHVWGGLLKAAGNYAPQHRFDGKLVLVNSSLPLNWVGHEFDDQTKGWRHFTTQPLDVYEIPADHMELFRDEYLDRLTAQVRDVLHEAMAEEAVMDNG